MKPYQQQDCKPQSKLCLETLPSEGQPEGERQVEEMGKSVERSEHWGQDGAMRQGWGRDGAIGVGEWAGRSHGGGEWAGWSQGAEMELLGRA